MAGPGTHRITVHRTEDLTDAPRAEIGELCVAAHGELEFRNLFGVYIPSGGRHFLARDADGTLVSHAVVTTRWLQPAGLPELRTAFVDAVSTLPSHQHRGFGSATLRRLASEVEDYEIAGLQTDLRGFYEPLGWELWRGPLAGRDRGALVPTPEQEGVMVLRLGRTPSLDLDGPLSIERQEHRIWE